MVFENTSISLPSESAKIIKENGYIGKEAILGIRPEDIHDEQEIINASEDSVVEAKVDVTEMMGSETYLYLVIEGNLVIARVDSRNKAKIGDVVKMAFDKYRIHLFDKETEEAIL